MKVRLTELPPEGRSEIAAAIRARTDTLVADLASVLGIDLATDSAAAGACAEVLLALLSTAVEAGELDGQRGAGRDLSRLAPSLTVRQVARAAHRVQRAVLDSLAMDHRFDPTSEWWRAIAYSVESAMLEVVAAFSERVTARTAVRDPLTTLLSADLFKFAVAQELVRARRHKHGIAVILFDIDDLSRLNQLHGYGAGDRLLERLGIFARSFFRTHDWVARHGDDSIAVVLSETTLDQAASVASRFCETVQQRLVLVDHRTDEPSVVSVSAAAVGTDLVGPELDADFVLAEAEAAVARAKLNGRGSIERVALHT